MSVWIVSTGIKISSLFQPISGNVLGRIDTEPVHPSPAVSSYANVSFYIDFQCWSIKRCINSLLPFLLSTAEGNKMFDNPLYICGCTGAQQCVVQTRYCWRKSSPRHGFVLTKLNRRTPLPPVALEADMASCSYFKQVLFSHIGSLKRVIIPPHLKTKQKVFTLCCMSRCCNTRLSSTTETFMRLWEHCLLDSCSRAKN